MSNEEDEDNALMARYKADREAVLVRYAELDAASELRRVERDRKLRAESPAAPLQLHGRFFGISSFISCN